jgi:predicted 2-oxoglutarate/Fe(II)-dependent dioxygenase YbiX
MKRKYVVGFHLNNDYKGGEYFLYYDNAKYEIDKTVGVVYTFDSELEHEITPITSNVRKSVVIFVNEHRIINNKHKNLI